MLTRLIRIAAAQIAEKPLDKWKGSVPAWISSMDSFVREYYEELTAKKAP